VAKLVVRQGRNAGQEHPIPAEASLIVLGRQSACDVQVFDEKASRNHAEISVRAGRLVLRDLGSSNGTRLNGRRIDSAEELEPGDTIQIGEAVYELVAEGAGVVGMETPAALPAADEVESDIPPPHRAARGRWRRRTTWHRAVLVACALAGAALFFTAAILVAQRWPGPGAGPADAPRAVAWDTDGKADEWPPPPPAAPADGPMNGHPGVRPESPRSVAGQVVDTNGAEGEDPFSEAPPPEEPMPGTTDLADEPVAETPVVEPVVEREDGALGVDLAAAPAQEAASSPGPADAAAAAGPAGEKLIDLKALGPRAAEMRSVTGAHARVVWVQDIGDNRDTFARGERLKLVGFDTDDGRDERDIVPAISNFAQPMMTPKGTRVVFSNTIEKTAYIVNWDGTGLRPLVKGVAADVWIDPRTGVEWVYVQAGAGDIGGSYKQNPIWRCQIDKPRVQELAWNKSQVDIVRFSNFQLSADGTRAGGAFPWNECGVANLLAGTWEILGRGCWASLAPDNSYLFWHFDGPHRNVFIYTPDGLRNWKVAINTAPGVGPMHEVVNV